MSEVEPEYKTYRTNMGLVTVYTKGKKAGTTETGWEDPPPIQMKLKKKYRG